MRKITLNKMRIENFKGIKSLEIDFDGKNTLISGFNGVGKSTIADAYFWATTGKNTALSARFEVRPRNEQGNEVHDVITSVECEFSVAQDDGDAFTFTLRRDECEDLTKKEREQLKPETIAPKKSYYFLDDAPYDAKIFYDKIAGLMCNKDKFTILSNPFAFFALEEKQQRDLLTAACGDVQDSEIEGYDRVKEICGAINTPVQVKDALSKAIKAAQKRLDEIPARIDSLSELCDEYADYDKKIDEIQVKQAVIQSEGEGLKAERDRLMQQRQQECVLPPDKNAVIDLEIELRRMTNELEICEQKVADDITSQEHCPNCGFALKDNSADIEADKKEVVIVKGKVKDLTEKLARAQADYDKAYAEYEQYKNETNDSGELFNKVKELSSKIDDKRDEYVELTVELGKLMAMQKVQREIKTLRDEQKKLDDELADSMTKFDIISAFILKKAESAVENINKRFKTVRFKLFEMQTNGELKTCCKATVDGVSYANINTAKKVQVGIELANLLSNYLGVKCPMFLDNTESVFNIPHFDTQIIKLRADKTKPTLMVEAEVD